MKSQKMSLISSKNKSTLQLILLALCIPAILLAFRSWYYYGNYQIIFFVIGILLSGLLLKRNTSLSFTVFAIGSWITLGYAVYKSDGIHTPGLVFLISLPLWSILIQSQRTAIINYGICAGIIVFSYFASTQQLFPPTVISNDFFALNRLILLLTTMSITFLIAFLLRRKIENEHSALLDSYQDSIRQIEALNLKTQLVIEKDSHKEVLMSILTHDIATPLNVSRDALSQLEKDAFTQNTTHYLKQIRNGVESTSQLIEKASAFLQTQSDEFPIRLEALDLNSCFQNIYNLMKQTALDKKVTIIFEPTQLKISADPTYFNNVLFNIVSNAIKYSSIGETIRLAAFLTPENKVCIEITDQGIGIPPEFIDQLFSIKTKVSTPGTQGEKGTGLGLPLVKYYLDQMNAHIQIQSYTESSKFRLRGTTVRLFMNIPNSF